MQTPSWSKYNVILPPPVVKDGVEEYKVEWIFWTVGYSEANWNIWYVGRDMGSKKTSGDQSRTLEVQDD